MPAGARYVQGSAVPHRLYDEYGRARSTTRSSPAPAFRGRLDTLAYGHAYSLAFQLRPGFELGTEHATATLATAGLADKSAQADVSVGDTFEATTRRSLLHRSAPARCTSRISETARTSTTRRLQITPGNAPAGTRIKVFLSHLHSDGRPRRLRSPWMRPCVLVRSARSPSARYRPASSRCSSAGAPAARAGHGARPALRRAPPRATSSSASPTAAERPTRRSTVTSTGQTGALLIQVSSYDGHPTTDPYVVRVELDPPAALPPCTQSGPGRIRPDRGRATDGRIDPAHRADADPLRSESVSVSTTTRPTRTRSTPSCRHTPREAT